MIRLLCFVLALAIHADAAAQEFSLEESATREIAFPERTC
jgi:hypothetical protein